MKLTGPAVGLEDDMAESNAGGVRVQRRVRPLLGKVTEPAEGLVHFMGSPGLDAVTLCGKMDFIGEEPGVITEEPATCDACWAIVNHIKGHRAV